MWEHFYLQSELYPIIALLCLAAMGVLLACRLRRSPAVDRFAVSLLPAVAGAALFIAWAAFRLVPHWSWSAARLASSFRIVQAVPLYTGPEDATINGWIYGPVSALAYLPAVLADDPLGALRIASLLNAIYFLLPLAVVLLPAWRERPQRISVYFLAGFGVGALLLPYGTWYCAAALSSDTVAFCLGALSCVALARGDRLPLAGALLVLAVWTKQTEAPLAVIQIAFLAWTRGWRVALTFTALIAAGLLATTVAFALWFGAKELWFCMVEIPSKHPLELERIGSHLTSYVLATWWVWLLAVLRYHRRKADADVNPFDRPAALLLIASIALLPMGLAAAAKAGGDQNSIHSLYYAVLGGIALAAGRMLRAPATWKRIVLLGAAAGFLTFNVHRVFAMKHLEVTHPGAQHQAAFVMARENPGRVYFPCNPLIGLMVERRNYVFDYGVLDWRLAGAAPPPSTLRATLPSSIAMVVYHRGDPSREMLRAFPEFDRRVLSGAWEMYGPGSHPSPPDTAGRQAPTP